MNFLKKLFGGKAEAELSAETYDGFRIIADPLREGAKYRLAARIELDVGDETKVFQVIRADTFDDFDSAKKVSIVKAKQVIDENGKALFQ